MRSPGDERSIEAVAGGHAAPVTQVAIGDVAGVTAPTVRKRWEELKTR